MSLSYNHVTIFNYSSYVSEGATEYFFKPPTSETYLFIMCVLITFGIFSNILGVFVLSRIQKRNPGVRLLKFLAVVDITVLVYKSFSIVFCNSHGLPISVVIILYEIVRLSHPLGRTCYTFEIYFTVLIACQRVLVVAKPLQASRYLRRSIINISIIVLLVFSILFNLPHWFTFNYKLYWDNVLNITWITSEHSEFYYSNMFKFYYIYITYSFRVVVSLVNLVVWNSITIVFSRRHTIQSTGENHNQLVGMNIAIILMSMITHVATALDRALHITGTKIQVIDAILVLNCSANFVFYCIFGRSFRKKLRDVFQNVCCNTRNKT